MSKHKYIKIVFIVLLMVSFPFCTNEPEKKPTVNYEWETAVPEDVGLNTELLNSGLSEASKQSYINSVLIIKDGKIAAEKYFNGYTQNSANLVRSVSKSFLSAAYGIAIENFTLSLNDKIMDYLSEHKESIIDNRYNTITILDLLQMKGGLDNDRNIYFKVFNSNNWLKTIFSLGLKYSPGAKFSYSTPGAHLLSAVLTKASGISSKEYVETNLIAPMEISLEDWEKDLQGIYFGGNNMYFTSRNMAAFGMMYLNNGLLGGKQIITKDWVEKSLTDHTGGIGEWGVLKNMGYGLFWWLGEMNDKKIFTAIGHGGQFIMCIPSVSMIIVTTANSNIYWEEADKQETKIMEIMSEYFLPAVK